jgi:uncharacterized RDD family membrane protein YckC
MHPELEDTLAVPLAGAAAEKLPERRPAGVSDKAGSGTAATVLLPGPSPTPGHAPAPGKTATAPGSSSPSLAGPGLAAGQQLGHFRIERPLGAGGMGEVYLATDLALDRPVAIKVLPEGLARDPVRRDRMIREARAQARVSHPNVGHIYFIGEELGRLYFAMEFVAGETVADRIARGPLTAEDALSIVRSAALGLREAQRSGITHRDVKPSNLMIDGHGMVKVLDFGLAAGGPGALGDGPVAQTSLAGTPLYMAPEQARGEPVDFRADIYALGATLYHLVSGKPPFEADTLDGLLTKHASASRPALPRRSDTPRTAIAAIDTLISRMMAPSPSVRFASYDELIRAIELTSVDHMRPAGFWVRSMATGVDLLIAFLIVLPLTLVLNMGDNTRWLLVLPIHIALCTFLIIKRGRTLGKSLFELEVVDTRTGNRPGLTGTLLRSGLPVLVLFLAAMVSGVVGALGYKLKGIADAALIIFSCSPPVALLWASLRSLGKRTPWDHWSGTMVRYRTRRGPQI